ncbi:unnamed protein product [Caenorhabditis nigoni]
MIQSPSTVFSPSSILLTPGVYHSYMLIYSCSSSLPPIILAAYLSLVSRCFSYYSSYNSNGSIAVFDHHRKNESNPP